MFTELDKVRIMGALNARIGSLGETAYVYKGTPIGDDYAMVRDEYVTLLNKVKDMETNG